MKCTLAPTCFGSPLEDLCRVVAPISTISTSVQEAAKSGTMELPMPKELWRMIDFISAHIQTADGLFLTPCDATQEQTIRECLDTDTPFPVDTPPQAVSSVLLEFLMALPDPIVPVELLDAYCLEYIREGRRRSDIANSFVKRLGPVQTSCFSGVMCILRTLSQRQSLELVLAPVVEALTHAEKDKKKRTNTDPRECQLQRLHRICFLSLFIY